MSKTRGFCPKCHSILVDFGTQKEEIEDGRWIEYELIFCPERDCDYYWRKDAHDVAAPEAVTVEVEAQHGR